MNLKITIVLLLIGLSINAQTKQETIRKEVDFGIYLKESFYVLKQDTVVKHGKYILKTERKIISTGEYVNNERTGHWNFSSYDGKIKWEGDYINGQRNGPWIYLRENSKSAEVFYTAGKVDSAFSFYPKGKPRAELNYDQSRQGKFRSFYQDGQLKEEIELSDDLYDGLYRRYFDNGQIHSELTFKEGHYSTSHKAFDYSGSSIKQGTLKDGTGSIYRYKIPFKQKKKLRSIAIENYKNGKLNGHQIYFDKYGKLSMEGMITNNWRDGDWKFYYDHKESPEIINYNVNDSTNLQDMKIVIAANKLIGGNNSDAQTKPQFPGGSEMFFKYLKLYIDPQLVPLGAHFNILTTINADGIFENPEFIMELNLEEKDTEKILDALKNMPQWDPAFKDGLPVPIRMPLRVRF